MTRELNLLTLARLRAALLLTLLLAVAVLLLHPRPRAVGAIVGTVNGEALTQEQFAAEVGLQVVRNELAGKDRPVEPALILNRLIGDILLLQGASRAGIIIPAAVTENEIDAILARQGQTRREMAQLLARHDVSWSYFRTSVADYLRLSRFIDGPLLAATAGGQRQEALQSWLADQYNVATLQFEPAFLDAVNTSVDRLGEQQG